MIKFKKDYSLKVIFLTLILTLSFTDVFSSFSYSKEILRLHIGDKSADNTYYRMLQKMGILVLSDDFLENTERSAKIFLPHTEVLTAINILLAHKNILDIGKIVVDFHAKKNLAVVEKGVLKIGIESLEDLRVIDVLSIVRQDLAWDFTDTIRSLGREYPYLLLDAEDFDAMNVILHRRMAGLGDLVFVSNAAQVLHYILPDKKIRAIFHSDEDFKLACSTKLFKGLDPGLPKQTVEGVEVISGEKRGLNHIGEDDISIVYALGADDQEVFQSNRLFRRYAGDAKVHIFVYELGFRSLTQDPLESGEAYLGFREGQIGMPPVSPKNKDIYSKKYPRQDERIRSERKRIIKKFNGWEELNSILQQQDLNRTVNSEWGFLYAHNPNTVRRYFDIFENARTAVDGYKKIDTTFFLMCRRKDISVHKEINEIVRENGYNLFIYEDQEEKLRPSYVSQDSNVAIIMDYSVPRKLFSELFLYSDDLPTVVTGQDNLANILYLNRLSSGRPFFWEVLIFQDGAKFDILNFLEQHLSKPDADYCRMLWNLHAGHKDQAEMFFAPRKYREFFKKIAVTLDQYKTFSTQMYYLILRQLQKQMHRVNRAEELIAQLNHRNLSSVKQIISFEVKDLQRDL